MKAKLNSLSAAFLVILAFTCGCVSPGSASRYTHEEMKDMLVEGAYTSPNTGIRINYRSYLPYVDYPEKLPLVIFLHGAGHNGSDNLQQLMEYDVGYIAHHAVNKQKAFLLVPQCPTGKEWPTDEMTTTLHDLITYVTSIAPAIDKSRVIVTGYSMGGIGSFELSRKHPDTFAAVVPVCGGWLSTCKWTRPIVPNDFSTISLWTFNNLDDKVVDNLYAKQFLAQVSELENRNAHATDGWHGHTDEYVYANRQILEWMFSQKKKTDKTVKEPEGK